MSLVALAMRGYRWHRVMALAHVDHQRSDALGLTAVAYMGNNVLPARGGEVLKIAILGARSTSRRREILGSVVAERLLDAMVLAGMFVVLSLGLADSPAGTGTSLLIGGGLVACFVALAIYLWLRRSGRFERFATMIRPVARACRLFAHPSGIPLVALSVAIWALDGLNLVVIGQSIGISIKPLDGMLVVVLASLVAAVPAAPGFAGTFDAGLLLGPEGRGHHRRRGLGHPHPQPLHVLPAGDGRRPDPARHPLRRARGATPDAGRRPGTASRAPARRAASGGIDALAPGSAGAGR